MHGRVCDKLQRHTLAISLFAIFSAFRDCVLDVITRDLIALVTVLSLEVRHWSLEVRQFGRTSPPQIRSFVRFGESFSHSNHARRFVRTIKGCDDGR